MAHSLVLFYTFASLAVVSSLLVIAQPNPIYSVLLLIASFVGLAGLYVLLNAPFVAVTQIIVYAGAIMVLFLFVVMLLVPREEPHDAGPLPGASRARAFGTVLAGLLLLELWWALAGSSRLAAGSGAERETSWSVQEIGEILFRDYAFAFEATSVLILVAMVGAIVLARRAPAATRQDRSHETGPDG